MLKAPRPGEVKTRLARETGDVEAAAIYRAIVEHQIRQVPAGWKIEVHFAPHDARDEMQRWLHPLHAGQIEFLPQAAGDLGVRLRSALKSAFDRGGTRVLFAGGDCPGLDRAVLSDAAARLDAADVVAVPAIDGGYVLIGSSAPHPGIFDDIAWSTPQVMHETLTRAARLNLKVTLLAPLEDVDDLPGWLRTRRLLVA